jgi:hypothetical protein
VCIIGFKFIEYWNAPILSSYCDYSSSGIVKKPYSLDEFGKVHHELLASWLDRNQLNVLWKWVDLARQNSGLEYADE